MEATEAIKTGDSDDLSGENTTLTCTRAAWISVNFWSNMDGPAHSLHNAFQWMSAKTESCHCTCCAVVEHKLCNTAGQLEQS